MLPISAVLLLLMGTALAQEPIPASTRAYLATVAYLDTCPLPDLTRVASQAHSGDREAQYLMALAYEGSRLVPQDFAAARSWMRNSAEQGYLPAQAGMGEMYLNGIRDNGTIPDYVDAEKWLRLAATQGDAGAQFWLGTGFERGYFGVFDYRQALKWLRKAAAQGLPNAQLSLGQMYEDGEGVPENDSLAASWYRKAADHFLEDKSAGGVLEAEVQLAYMYRDGRLPRDDVQAYMWFAIVGASFDPPIDDDVKEVARHMTRAQIVQAQRLAEDWVKRHRHQPPTRGDNSLGHVQLAK